MERRNEFTSIQPGSNEWNREIKPGRSDLPIATGICENDTELYWLIALEMYRSIADAPAGDPVRFIVPVGPVFQYRRFITLVDQLPLDLSGLHLYFMDEYLSEDGGAVDTSHPLSFSGFIDRELIHPLGTRHDFNPDQVFFPDPADPAAYDLRIADGGGIDVCFAGVGINGHLAFNEAPSAADSPSRVIALTEETRVTNGHTALGGDWQRIPRRAVSVGMKSILESRKLRIYCNRPWQKAVVRKLLFGPVTEAFPASFARNHPDVTLTITAEVADSPEPALK
jgi:glucosamine-6-phosphate deaminase